MIICKSLIAIAAVFASYNARCQEVIVSASKMNIVYTGHQNELLIMVDSLPCKHMYVTANGEKIEGRDCRYVYTPRQPGLVDVKISNIAAKGEILERFSLRAKPIPEGKILIGDIVAVFPDSKDGYITRAALLAAKAPIVMAPYHYSGVDYTLEQYTLLVSNAAGKLIYRKVYAGEQALNFEETARTVFAYLHHNDVVAITDVLCKRGDGKIVSIPDASLKIAH